MPLYEFQSDNGKVVELFFKMGSCPENIVDNGEAYHRIFSVPNIAVDSTKPKTIGDLGRKNYETAIKNGTIAPKPKKENPWWRKNKNKPDKDLGKLSSKQLERYILEGKK